MPATTAAKPRAAGRRASARSAARGGPRLVIVESPAKARTISGYLGDGYVVESSIGHIRDLPRNASDVPASHKGQPWARLGVDVDNGFAPLYVVSAEKRAQVAKLRSLVKEASEVYLATDEDREGEAIAWHLLETLKPTVPVHRMVFHEITPQAIEAAVANPRELDRRLVDAQETRRILDRLYGYEVSPVLWKKVMPKLSAGRVQSVATRVLVERERARMRFVAASYWDVTATLRTGRDGDPVVEATLSTLDGRRVATGRDFGEDGVLRGAAEVRDVVRLDEASARGLAERLAPARFTVRAVEDKPYRRSPYPPFMTSTLQQEAARKLRFTSQRSMQVAQRLYENGYITYMRTDSISLSETAVRAARSQALDLYGPQYVPDAPRSYHRKVKNAQEAHEAVRPAGDTFRTPGSVRSELGTDEYRLYELIWQRTIASQMADARGTSARVVVGATTGAGEDAEFVATGKTITFPGFLRAYVEGADDPDAELEDRERRLPVLAEADRLTAERLDPQGHSTAPPARFTEASLVKALEEMGVGRPSTYASIIGTVQDRGYVFKKGSALVPSFVAFAVVGLLERHFGRLVDYGFTASMEDDLDEIAGGGQRAEPWLRRFYFGAGAPSDVAGLQAMVSEQLSQIDAREVNSIPVGTDQDGEEIVVRVGRYGPYVQRGSGEAPARASVPEDLPPDELTVAMAGELLDRPSSDRPLGRHPDHDAEVLLKAGRYGPYVTTVPPAGGAARSSSLLSSMDPATVTLDDAVRLLTLPRVLGVDPTDGAEVSAQNGRYGPYVRKGTDSRSLQSEEELFTVTLADAMALFAAPRQRRGQRAAAAAPLRELGVDPASERPVVVREGRFGPYVTDGETNASLRKGDSVEEVTLVRAAELLEERRARGPVAPRKRAARAAPAGKAPAGKVPAKRVPTKRVAAKRVPAKRVSATKVAATKVAAKKSATKSAGTSGGKSAAGTDPGGSAATRPDVPPRR